MPLPGITDALIAAQKRGALPTSLSTAELRELGADVLARSVFSARASHTVFASDLKTILDRLAAGDLSEGQVRTAIWDLLDTLGYDAAKGGFPGEDLDPNLEGTLQDLKSFRRRDLIVRTQQDLMVGAGQQMRGQTPVMLSEYPAWELVRVMDKAIPRDWPARWKIAGGTLSAGGRMIALKGDPIWGELGSYDNFPDALGVDHPPFAFNSGMGWEELSTAEVRAAAVTGPDGETPEEWMATRPVTLQGRQPLPAPKVSLKGVDPELIARFKAATKGMESKTPGVFDFSEILAEDLKQGVAAYRAAQEAEKAAAIAAMPKGGRS